MNPELQKPMQVTWLQTTLDSALRDEPLSGLEALPAIVPRPEVVKESLSYNDLRILRAPAEKSYVYGNLVGLTDTAGLVRDLVSARLTVLKNLDNIKTRIHEKNIVHWFVRSRVTRCWATSSSNRKIANTPVRFIGYLK